MYTVFNPPHNNENSKMYTKTLSQDPLNLITLEEAKVQLNLMDSFTLDDDKITGFILSASQLAQKYTNRLMSSGVVMMGWDSYSNTVQLWGDDTESVTELSATNVYGEREIIPVTSYRFDELSQRLIVSGAYSYHVEFRATCTVTVGEPEPLVKLAVKMMVSTMYTNPDDYVTGVSVESMPRTSLDYLDTVKYYA